MMDGNQNEMEQRMQGLENNMNLLGRCIIFLEKNEQGKGRQAGAKEEGPHGGRGS